MHNRRTNFTSKFGFGEGVFVHGVMPLHVRRHCRLLFNLLGGFIESVVNFVEVAKTFLTEYLAALFHIVQSLEMPTTTISH